MLANGSGTDNVIVRGIGPSLSANGLSPALANPTLELRNSDGTLLLSNNDWQDNAAQAAAISGAGLAPGNALEAGIAASLPPGVYTALLAGLNNGTGFGLVEVYDLGDGDIPDANAWDIADTVAGADHDPRRNAAANAAAVESDPDTTAVESDADATGRRLRGELRRAGDPASRMDGDSGRRATARLGHFDDQF